MPYIHRGTTMTTKTTKTTMTTMTTKTTNAPATTSAAPALKVQTMWQLSFPLDYAVANELRNDKERLKAACMAQVSSFHAPVPDMIALTKLADMIATPVFDFNPIELDCLKKYPRVVLIGDASHAMSPFKSQGANRAIIDASILAEKLSTLPIAEAVVSYERDTAKVNKRKVMVSRDKVAKLHCPDDANDFRTRTDVPNYHLTATLKENNVGSWTHNLDQVIKSLVVVPAQPKKNKGGEGKKKGVDR
jgi:2-polyprenyl-6-methoxyphenol hydroxylase-like FAD-dependent oxidoreductase